MKESDLRNWHRTLGILLAFFIILQAGSGFLLSLDRFAVPRTHTHEESYASGHAHGEVESLWQESLEFVHHGGGNIGIIYRLFVGIALLVEVVLGVMIFVKIKARSKKH